MIDDPPWNLRRVGGEVKRLVKLDGDCNVVAGVGRLVIVPTAFVTGLLSNNSMAGAFTRIRSMRDKLVMTPSMVCL